MTPYDAAMVGVVLAGMAWGAWRGITWQVASLASLVLGYAVAFPASRQIAGVFPGDPVVARGLALLTVYVAVSCGVFALAWLIRATLRKLKFEAYDRHLGMVLGGAEGAMLGVVVTAFVISLAPAKREPILTSPSGKVVSLFLHQIRPIVPSEFQVVLAPFWGEEAPPEVEESLDDEAEPTGRKFGSLAAELERDRADRGLDRRRADDPVEEDDDRILERGVTELARRAGRGEVVDDIRSARRWVDDNEPDIRRRLDLGRRVLSGIDEVSGGEVSRALDSVGRRPEDARGGRGERSRRRLLDPLPTRPRGDEDDGTIERR